MSFEAITAISEAEENAKRMKAEALAAAKADRAGKPHALIARTVKGKGVSFMENQAGWHGKAPNAEQMETALAELAAPSGEESSRG